ncbi:hypothetical protein H5410_052349 [Solanum commersonii]|uniref:Uncharacterized protein n=1 Tax=Solanum commersonii TaxID=4109 RepID=A0A9J5X169_SOLCO|nr:hypothetical protein H5410_052349 [Solanum commersonii]
MANADLNKLCMEESNPMLKAVVRCKHGVLLHMQTSWSKSNPGRRFWSCPYYGGAGGAGCSRYAGCAGVGNEVGGARSDGCSRYAGCAGGVFIGLPLLLVVGKEVAVGGGGALSVGYVRGVGGAVVNINTSKNITFGLPLSLPKPDVLPLPLPELDVLPLPLPKPDGSSLADDWTFCGQPLFFFLSKLTWPSRHAFNFRWCNCWISSRYSPHFHVCDWLKNISIGSQVSFLTVAAIKYIAATTCAHVVGSILTGSAVAGSGSVLAGSVVVGFVVLIEVEVEDALAAVTAVV